MTAGTLPGMGLALSLALLATPVAPPAVQKLPPRPRLVLAISIDQYRADFLGRFAPYYLPPRQGNRLGGFRYLAETGANFLDAHHPHVPTETGPGHAQILTGSIPALSGIVANGWYDRALGRSVYVVDDPLSETVGGPSKPMSPRNLKVTTVGDELKMATNGRAKVVGIAFKDRGSILMAGHAADTVIWYDTGNGAWVSSTFYAPSKRLPEWVEAINASKASDKFFGKVWEPLLPPAAYALTRSAPFVRASSGPLPFSHRLGTPGAAPDRGFYNALFGTPFANDHLIQAAQRAVEAEELGRDEVPDVLAISMSANDYVGHAYGPNSPEVMDVSVRSDRQLSELFNFLNRRIPGGMESVVVVLTADHGVVPIPEESGGVYRTGATRPTEAPIVKAVEEALDRAHGDGDWILSGRIHSGHIHLDRNLIASKGLRAEDVERTAADAAMTQASVYVAFTRSQVMQNRLPAWEWAQEIARGYHPRLGGDVMIIEHPGDYFGGGTGTGHGSPWAYDTHVPIVLRGPGITRGTYAGRVTTSDIAPTLSLLLGIEYPTGNVGRPLPAIERRGR